jgi:hypothetical protein
METGSSRLILQVDYLECTRPTTRLEEYENSFEMNGIIRLLFQLSLSLAPKPALIVFLHFPKQIFPFPFRSSVSNWCRVSLMRRTSLSFLIFPK